MKDFTKPLLILGLIVLTALPAFAGPSVTYKYDKYGNRTAVTTQASDGTILEKTTYTYDNYRRPVEKVEAAQTGSNARRWTWYYDRWFGTQSYDPYAHTSKQWRVQVEPAYDGAGNRNVTARWYDANDRIVDEYTGVIEASNGAWSNGADLEVHHFTYAPNGQKETYTDPMGRVTTYVYDSRNRLHQTIEPKRADQATNPTTTLEYDFAGNKTDVTFPDTRSQHWRSYDAFGQPRRFTDERNNITDLNYWPWGPMKKLAQVITHRTRDDGGPEDQPTSLFYDGIGRPYATVFPDQSTERTFYEFGQVERSVTRKGQTKHTTYDARGRETSETWDNDAAPGVSRSWDGANRIVSLCNIYSTIRYTYDGAGLVLQEENTVTGSGGPAPIQYEHYPNGSVSQIQYPNGILVHRDYTSRGQLKTVSENTGGYWKVPVSYTYRGDGKVEHQQSRPGVQTNFTYDDRGMTKSIQHWKLSSNQELTSRTYYRDDRDRITSFQKGNNLSVNPMEDGRGDHYWYDAEGQLTDAYYGAVDPVNNPNSPVRTEHFEYDQLGNRHRNPANGADNLVATRGWLYFTRKNNGLNQYHTWGSDPVNYDDDISGGPGNGVTVQDGSFSADYNALNQPRWFWSGNVSGGFVSFGYDPLGRCVKRWNGGASDPATNPAMYLYYDGWNVIEEGPSAAAPSMVYYHGARVDEIVASYNTATDMMAYHYYDANGNCTMLTDWQGNIMEQYYYDAFGYPYFYNGSGTWLGYSPHGNRFLFTGREWLAELKLYDYRARMYQPEIGRFMQPDPKQFAAGDYNLYRYCHNDPVNKNDPMGLFAGITEGPLKDNWIVGLLSLDAKNQRKEVNETQAFYNAVDGFTSVWRQDGKKISAENIGRTVVDDAKEDAGKVELREGGRWGVEQATGEYVDGAKLVKKGPEPGLPYKWTPTALIPKWGDKIPLIGTHAHGPQSGMKAELQKLDQVSANGAFTKGVPYISAVGSSVDNGARIQIYVPHYGFFHSTDGVTFGVGK